jgi:hypothetical protein
VQAGSPSTVTWKTVVATARPCAPGMPPPARR